MTGLTALWLPIVLSAVVVFLVSSIIHMVSPWHKSDYPKLPNEAQVMDALRPLNIPPGDYFIPRPSSSADAKSPEFVEKMRKGPVVIMTVVAPGGMSMGRNLSLWMAYAAIIGVFSGYVAGRALPVGADYLHVFRFVGVTAFLSYSMALWQMSIWYNRSWVTTVKSTIDSLIYALLTAGMFGWLWPR